MWDSEEEPHVRENSMTESTDQASTAELSRYASTRPGS
jgi:hypothetical protein